MIDHINELHRGGDLIGEKMNDVEKLAYFRKKLTTVESMLSEIQTRRTDNMRERVLESDSSLYHGKLAELREKEAILYDEAFMGDDAHGSGTEWFETVTELQKLEREMIESSEHPDAPKARKIEALKEYRSYLDEKIHDLNDAKANLGYQSAAELGSELGVQPFGDKVLVED